MQVITLPSGKRVTGTNYVAAYKKLKAMTAEQRSQIRDYEWSWFANDGNDILREMRRGVHHRIYLRGQSA